MAIRRRSDLDLVIDTHANNKGLDQAADGLDKTATASKKLGKTFNDSAKEAKDFDHQLGELYRRRTEAIEKYYSTRDKLALKDRNSINREIRLVKALNNEVKEAARFAATGSTKVLDFGGEGIRPRNAAIGGLVAAGVVGSPAIGAVLAGALSGTVVGAAMAGGIVAASKSPEVKSAAKLAGSVIAAEFFSSGDSFVQPTAESLHILQDAFVDLDLDSAFSKAAPYVTTVARGIADLATNLMPGFNKLLDRAGPYSEIFAGGLSDMGTALGTFVDDISESPGALEGLYTGLKLLNGTIIVLGRSLNGLSDAFAWIVKQNADFTGLAEDIPLIGGLFKDANDTFEAIDKSADAVSFDRIYRDTNLAAGSMHSLAKATGELNNSLPATTTQTYSIGNAMRLFSDYLRNARQNADYLNQSLFDMFNAELNASRAADGWQAAIDALTESVKENGKTLDANTEKGRNNREMLRQLVQSALQQRDAELATGSSAQEANAAFAERIKIIEALAAKLGLAKSEIDKLVGVYEVTVITTFKTQGSPYSGKYLAPNERDTKKKTTKKKADGGTVIPGVEYMINERRRETVTFPATGNVNAKPASLSPVGGGIDYDRLGRTMAAAMTGMSVILNGQTVGRVQGRQANVLARGF